VDVKWVVAGGVVLGLAALGFGWLLGQLVYILMPDDRFDVWDDEDW
jgi:hypothetical protein